MKLFSHAIGLASIALLAEAANISLPAYPLAVKNPYLSIWLPGNQSDHTPTAQPMFWAGQPLKWEVIARVGSQAYCLLGCANVPNNVKTATQSGISFTSTHTLVNLQAGPAKITLDFFSSISLTDYTRQSLPYAYLSVSVDGGQSSLPTISVMSAIDDSWTAQQGSVDAQFQQTPGASMLSLTGQRSIAFSEKQQMATWGHTVLATSAKKASSYQIGAASSIHAAFASSGNLLNTASTYSQGDLAAMAQPLSADRPAIFAVGIQQDRAIQFLGSPQSPYYASEVQGLVNVTEHFLEDYSAALAESQQLDSKVKSIGNKVSSNYADILEAHMRQIFGGFQVTIPTSSLDTNSAMAFMKEISTDGNVNTLADLLPRALPAFYVLAPDYIRLLLEPVLTFSKQWPESYAVHDIGKHYPNATGETPAGEEKLLLDQTSVLLWMVYAYQKVSKNTQWIQSYIPILKKYADYLVQNGLYPPKQRSAVDSIQATANQTVLAIYSVIGIASFGELASSPNYTSKGREFANKILDLSVNAKDNHIITHYNDPGTSWIGTYPFAFDKLLGLGLFNQSIYDMQSDWYATQQHPNGMQFFSEVNKTVSTLEMWLAATSSSAVRNFFIDSIHKTLTNGLNSVPGPTIWNVAGSDVGVAFMTKAKSDVGSYFMVAAIDT